MAPAAPQLPTRFPCWCRAVYSWGGETKRDLGFVEGDLIECLNAGDGQWWMGRLRRDRRMVGLFPSNFVQVLEENFVPVTRSTSPMIQAAASPTTNPTSAPKKQKTVFRKPFQAHREALAPTGGSSASTSPVGSSIPQTPPRDGSLSRKTKASRTATSTSRKQSSLSRPLSVSRPPSRGASPRPPPQPQPEPERAVIPARSHSRAPPRAVSPRPPQQLEQELALVPARSYSQAPPRAVSPHPAQQLEQQLPLVLARSHSRAPPRAVSPRPPQHLDRELALVPTHSYSRAPPRAVSPRPSHQLEQQLALVPARSYSQAPPRAVSPHPPQQLEQQLALVPAHSHSRAPPRSVSPHPSHQVEPELAVVPVGSHSRDPSWTVSPRPPQHLDQQPVPVHAGSYYRPPSRGVSPRPPEQSDYLPPPVPNHLSQPSSREISPLQLTEREESPPPPPPPPHRVAVQRQPSPTPHVPAHVDMNERYAALSRTPSPAAQSENGQTPSPLRDAMEDVMTSLEDMGMSRESHSASPQPPFSNPWSPDTYGSLRDGHSPQRPIRPLTSLGFEGEKEYEYYDGGQPHRNSVYTHDAYADGPPQLNNYVQRMESHLRQMQEQSRRGSHDTQSPEDEEPPPPPPRNVPYHGRHNSTPAHYPYLKGRKSGHDLRGDILNRTYTNKSSTTNSSSGVQSNGTTQTVSTDRTSQSVMSGPSAGGFSATSAGSYARRGLGPGERPSTSLDTFRTRGFSDVTKMIRPETPLSGISYHSSHNTSRQGASSAIPWSSAGVPEESTAIFGGLSTPKAKKHGFFKKILESAKTGAANARSSIAVGQAGGSFSPTKGRAISPIHSSHSTRDTAAREMSLGNSTHDWVQVRRDVNRATSPSRNERVERAERCQMMDHPVIYAVEELYETAEGEESIDGLPISEPTNFGTLNLTLVDKSARFVNSLPPMTNPMSLAQGYICRPYKSDVQRLRAIFTWVSEKIAWDEPIEDGGIDLKRVLQTKRGCAEEVAFLVKEMCAAVGLHAEAIHGFLKTPGEMFDLDSLSRPNHWWNSVLVDGEWRFMDCSLASPTNPRRALYVTNTTLAEPWYFLARPLEFCYTHVPLIPETQHICPPISPDVLLALPAACPAYFKMNMQFPDYDTSVIRIDGLEVLQIRLLVPPDVECAAEIEAPAFACDADGDFFESGEIVRKRALVQPDWVNGQKRITVKAVLPGDEGQAMVKVYAGRKGLMHSSRDIPHPLAFALPILHTGENPPYEFVLRHPTPHAQRHDLYIIQPQCAKLAVNNTFVFAVRQHPSSLSFAAASTENSFSGRISPSVFSRPASALSMISSSAGGSSVSTVSNEFSASTSAISSTRSSSGREKPAKLAIQSPSGKILRLTRKADHMISTPNTSDSLSECTADGSVWETVIKIGERGVWRGLVLADRVARWCVFCEWECF